MSYASAENPNARPTNSFETFHWMMSGKDKPKSVNATVISLHLIFLCGMSKKDYCEVSMSTLKKRTGLSEMTVRRAITELEDLGEWVGVRSTGRTRTRYYPMFIENAQTHLLETVQADRLARKLVNKERTSKAKADEQPSTPSVQTPVPAAEPTAETVVEPKASVELNDSKVKTARDAEIRDLYLATQAHKNSDDYDYDVPLPVQGVVVDCMTTEEATTFIYSDEPEQIFLAGSEDGILEELAGRWITRFGAGYGDTHTYSHIQDTYDALVERDTTRRKIADIDACMFVLGSMRKAISVGFIQAILFKEPAALDPEARAIRSRVDATVAAREHTRRLSSLNHYGNYAGAARMLPATRPQAKVYSDTL